MSVPEEQLAALPDHPGVYIFRDGKGKILYIGKAASLKKRVRSYFRGRPDRAKTALLLTRVAACEVILAGSEVEALLLENNLIKQHQPPFNIDLKDDKNYPYVRIDFGQDFPRLEIVRRRRPDGARYFGPYPAVTALRSTLKILNRHFRLRRCRTSRFRNRVRPCLNFQMGYCSGPCCGEISPAGYRRALAAAALILGGRGRPVLNGLRRRMAAAARRLDFEEAARLRDALADLEQVLESQEIDAGRNEELDVLAVAGDDEGRVVLYQLRIRRGFVVGGRPFAFPDYGGRLEELPAAFLQRHFAAGQAGEAPPPVIVGPGFGEVRAGLEEWLGKLAGRRVRLVVPQRGRRLKLLRLAEKNAADFLAREVRAAARPAAALAEIARVMKLPVPPRVIEGLDISNLQQEGVVAALVSFREGRKNPDGYRRYRLDFPPPDDFARMAVVIRRRFAPEKPCSLPDLLLLDGGRAQLAAVARVLAELGVEVPLVAIAKGRSPEGRKSRPAPDLFYASGRREPLPFAERSPARLLLEEVRDEAHRFAVEYHRLRRRRNRETVLTGIDGIGPRRAARLLQAFGSVEAIAAAGCDELVAKGGLPRPVAEKVVGFFRVYG